MILRKLKKTAPHHSARRSAFNNERRPIRRGNARLPKPQTYRTARRIVNANPFLPNLNCGIALDILFPIAAVIRDRARHKIDIVAHDAGPP
jgi:hypothetical protein